MRTSIVGQTVDVPELAAHRRHSHRTDAITALPLELLVMITMPSFVAGIICMRLSQPLFDPPCPTPV